MCNVVVVCCMMSCACLLCLCAIDLHGIVVVCCVRVRCFVRVCVLAF